MKDVVPRKKTKTVVVVLVNVHFLFLFFYISVTKISSGRGNCDSCQSGAKEKTVRCTVVMDLESLQREEVRAVGWSNRLSDFDTRD